jgi:hypothetical protein
VFDTSPIGAAMEITDEFARHFSAKDLDELDRDAAVIYGLDAELRLSLFNEAWFDFAAHNGTSRRFYVDYGLGSSYIGALPQVLHGFFVERIRSSIEHGKTWSFDYLCPSPVHYRKFRMNVMPLADLAGCLVTNRLLVEVPHEVELPSDAVRPIEAYIRREGLVTMCSHCRCTRRVADPSHWDWVPQLVENPPEKVTHSICPSCFVYFHGEPASR